MIKLTKGLIFALFIGFFSFALPALAYYPSLSISNNGGDTVSISINGAQPNSSIALSYTATGSTLATTISNFGYTDYSGNYTASASASAYGFSSGSQIYVTVAGQQSNSVNYFGYGGGYYGGCTYNCGSPYGFSLSQNSLSLNVGQSSTVTGYVSGSSFSYSNAVYISSNSNPSVATASVSGNQVYIYGVANGVATISICQTASGGNCVSLIVTVSGGNVGPCGYYGAYNCSSLALSQTAVSLNVGQNSTILITNGSYSSGSYSNLYYVYSNSNPSVATASLNGSNLYINALSNGSTTIKICQTSNSNNCGTVYVTVNGSVLGATNYPVNIYDGYFTPQTITIPVGASITWRNSGYGSHSIIFDNTYGSSGLLAQGASYYLTFNTAGTYYYRDAYNSGLTGTVIVTGSTGGYSGGGYGYGGGLTLSQNSLSINVGQNSSVYVTGSGSYYVSTNTSPYVATASLSGSTVYVNGLSGGTTTITICQTSYNVCTALYVSVGSQYYYGGGGGGLQYPGGSGGAVLGSNTYSNGTLISEYGTVYITYKNLKTPFTNASAFTGLGFSFSNVISVGSNNLVNSGYPVNSSYVQHPWGSWIKSGNTIYFVHELGLIAVPSWDIFLNNGGQSSMVVPANSYDFRLSIQSSMTYNDSRLK